MKQILVPKYFFNSGKTNQFSTDTTHANPLGFVSLDAPDTFLSAAPTKDFAIMYRAGKTQAPMTVEVDYNSLTIVKQSSISGVKGVYSFTCPTGEAGKTYTINIIKKGVVPHERNIWRVSITLKTDCTATELATMLFQQFAKLRKSEGTVYKDVIITDAGVGDIDIDFANYGINYEIQLTDGLSGITLNNSSVNHPGTLTIKDLENLISEGIGNRGVQYRYEEGPSIYPFIEELDESKSYGVYTFRFAVGRKASKTRDEIVYQLVHFIVDPALTALTTFIESIKSDSD